MLTRENFIVIALITRNIPVVRLKLAYIYYSLGLTEELLPSDATLPKTVFTDRWKERLACVTARLICRPPTTYVPRYRLIDPRKETVTICSSYRSACYI